MWVATCDVGDVFSAHAEVVPMFEQDVEKVLGILRARGGSSWCGLRWGVWCVYSPRTRR